jgi:transcription antitermination factor NusG
MAETNEDPWFVLHVLTNHEKRVARHLDIFAVEHYVPQYTERSRWSDRTVQLERPLFRGYVFARFQPDGRRRVQSAPGVLKILGKDTLDMVSNSEIERIRRALSAGCALRPHNQITTGKPVRVCRGIFEGAEGVVAELRRNCNVILRLSGVDQYFSLEIGQDDIELLPETKLGEVKQPSTSSHRTDSSRNSRIA